MGPAEDIEKMVKQNKIHLSTTCKMDKQILEDSFAAMDETINAKAPAEGKNLWRIIMHNRITKIAAAAAIIIAVTLVINSLIASDNYTPGTVIADAGTHKLSDGSKVTLKNNAKVQLYDNKQKRGFRHIAGQIEVDVAKGKGEFVIETPHGNAKALGTVFTMDLIDDVPRNRSERLQLLALQVTEGTVELSNNMGILLVKENQAATLQKDQAPYDFTQDKNLPPRVIERIQAMLDAFEDQDAEAWTANFNFKAIYDLAHGNIPDYTQHPWFSQMSPQDVENLKNNLASVPLEQLQKEMIAGTNLKGATSMYIRSAEILEDGTTVTAECVRKTNNILCTTPKWAYFDGDWWQIDD